MEVERFDKSGFKSILEKNISFDSLHSEKSLNRNINLNDFFGKKTNTNFKIENGLENQKSNERKIYFLEDNLIDSEIRELGKKIELEKNINLEKKFYTQNLKIHKELNLKDTKDTKKNPKKKFKDKTKIAEKKQNQYQTEQIFNALSKDLEKAQNIQKIKNPHKNILIKKIIKTLQEKKLNNTFPISYKKLIIEMSKFFGIEKISKITGVLKKNIKRWILKGVLRKKGAGRKISDLGLENKLVKWTLDNIAVGGRIPKRCKIMKMARLKKRGGFKASKGWCDKFLRRNKNLFFDKLRDKEFNKKIIF